jgi:hypothetical protein
VVLACDDEGVVVRPAGRRGRRHRGRLGHGRRHGFAIIGITGLLAGLIALGGPKTSGHSLEKVTQ